MNPRFRTVLADSLSSVNMIRDRLAVGVCLRRSAVTLVIFNPFSFSHSLSVSIILVLVSSGASFAVRVTSIVALSRFASACCSRFAELACG